MLVQNSPCRYAGQGISSRSKSAQPLYLRFNLLVPIFLWCTNPWGAYLNHFFCLGCRFCLLFLRLLFLLSFTSAPWCYRTTWWYPESILKLSAFRYWVWNSWSSSHLAPSRRCAFTLRFHFSSTNIPPRPSHLWILPAPTFRGVVALPIVSCYLPIFDPYSSTSEDARQNFLGCWWLSLSLEQIIIIKIIIIIRIFKIMIIIMPKAIKFTSNWEDYLVI